MRTFDSLWQDIRFGARQLRLNPGFAAVAIASLALGVGANTAIFQLLDAVRLRSLPVSHPEELLEVKIAKDPHCCSGNFTARRSNLTNPQWEYLREHQQAFSSVMAWSDHRFNLAGGGEAQYAEGLWVSGDYFRTLQVPPLIGRVFTPEDDRRGCGSPGVVLGYGFWQKHFGGDPSVAGKKLVLSGYPFTVTGVAPANFFGVEVGRTFDVAVPICSQPLVTESNRMDQRATWWLASIGRLKPGWTMEKASAQLTTISPGLFESTVPPGYRSDLAKYYRGYRMTALEAGTGVSNLRRNYESPLLLLIGIAALVLIIACANLANLMLARASVRERELAIRLAVGASRPQIIRQLLVESLLIAAFGAGVGALLAQYLSRVLVAFLSTKGNPVFLNLGTDWRILGFTAGLAVLACILFGLAPALRASAGSPVDAMRSGRGQTAGREKFGVRRALAASQVALSLLLVVSALLFVRSFRNLMTLDAGFRQSGILITGLDVRRAGFSEQRRGAAYRQFLETLRATPGIEAAATVDIIPISGNRWNGNIRIDAAPDHGKKELLSDFNRVSAGYFGTMGTPLLAGRDFSARDLVGSTKVAIVDEAFAQKFLGGANPIGLTFRHMQGQGEPDVVYEIVGLSKNMKYQSLRDEFTPTIFVASTQEMHPDTGASYIVRSRLPLETLTSEIKQMTNALHPEISIEFRVLNRMMEESLLRERLMAVLSGFFGGLAVILATIGLYGVISYMVTRRQNEIGIRMALGAGAGSVLGLVLREAGMLLGIGLAVGVVLTIALGRLTAALIFGMKPNDPVTIALAGVGLAAVALAASYIPARRAARLDPMVTLRAE
jgi:putative ABC transport system permease protein